MALVIFSSIVFFASARMPGGASIKQTGIGALLVGSWTSAQTSKQTRRYNRGLVYAAEPAIRSLRIAANPSTSRRNHSSFGAVVQVQRAISKNAAFTADDSSNLYSQVQCWKHHAQRV